MTTKIQMLTKPQTTPAANQMPFLFDNQYEHYVNNVCKLSFKRTNFLTKQIYI